ncbi:hypothetical protein CLV48_1163 [Cecembia rubra]|uniref:WG repeat protein n=2 Tax=Cecembia rubra TaxID=1485585 RepID=A0A2P8DRG8_9BACT|nr:hypothetical protein CLV48_1163 [Cecembia rubra]
MKVKILIYLCLFVLTSNSLYAQYSYTMVNDSAGIYLTFEDFEAGKLTNGFKPYQKNYSLWPQGFFKNKDIELKTPDTSVIYRRSDIWGYTDHKGRLIRVFNDKHYKVLCDKGLIIYIIYSPTRTSYHFSKTLNDPINRLTKNNLAAIYIDNPDLLQRINSIKKKHWLTWDVKKESYFINELFLE